MVMVLSLEMEHGCAHCPLPTCLLGGYVLPDPGQGLTQACLPTGVHYALAGTGVHIQRFFLLIV